MIISRVIWNSDVPFAQAGTNILSSCDLDEFNTHQTFIWDRSMNKANASEQNSVKIHMGTAIPDQISGLASLVSYLQQGLWIRYVFNEKP